MQTTFKTTLAAVLVLALAGAASAATVTVTGQNGGSSVTTGTCTRSTGQLVCNSHTVLTGKNGGIGTRDRATTFAPGQITSTVTGTRANGKGFGHTTTITR